MENRKVRRKIIDTTSVQRCRKAEGLSIKPNGVNGDAHAAGNNKHSTSGTAKKPSDIPKENIRGPEGIVNNNHNTCDITKKPSTISEDGIDGAERILNYNHNTCEIAKKPGTIAEETIDGAEGIVNNNNHNTYNIEKKSSIVETPCGSQKHTEQQNDSFQENADNKPDNSDDTNMTNRNEIKTDKDIDINIPEIFIVQQDVKALGDLEKCSLTKTETDHKHLEIFELEDAVSSGTFHQLSNTSNETERKVGTLTERTIHVSKAVHIQEGNTVLKTKAFHCKTNEVFALKRTQLQYLFNEDGSEIGSKQICINPIFSESPTFERDNNSKQVNTYEINEQVNTYEINEFDADVSCSSISRHRDNDEYFNTRHSNEEQCSSSLYVLETKDPYSIELERTKTFHSDCPAADHISNLFADIYKECVRDMDETGPLLDSISMHIDLGEEADEEEEADKDEDVYSAMTEGPNGTPRLLTVEEKWQVIFNEKTRAPIYAVAQYVEYLNQFVNGQSTASRDTSDVIKKDGINPISYLLRKLKLDLKMSYDSFLDELLKPGNNGMSLLIKLLKSIQNTGSQQSGSTNRSQLKNYKKTLTDEHDCLLCIKFALRTKAALVALMEITYGLETVAMSLLSTFTKSRGTAIEILTVSLSAQEGFSRTLDCFTVLRLKIGEPVRFKSLMNMMNLDSQQNVIFKVSCMKFMNSLLDAATNLNMRVYVQYELESAGLDINYMIEKTVGNGLEYDDLRHELAAWKRKYIDVETLMSRKDSVVIQTPDTAHKHMIETLQKQVQVISAEKSHLERQLTAVSTELRSRYEEIQRRTPITQNASTQCEDTRSHTRDVGCQCIEHTNSTVDEWGNPPLANAAQYFGWRDTTSCPNEENAIRYLDYQLRNEQQHEHVTSDDESVEKVHHWLHSHCDSESDLDILPYCVTEKDTPHNKHSFNHRQRKQSERQRGHRLDFPGNWKLIPKSIEQFPSRFPTLQCHQTNCDRCDIGNRLENIHSKQVIVQNVSHPFSSSPHLKQTDTKRPDAKSQSSDSAIGGSGERLWSSKDRRIPLLPTGMSEADILQDLIQPDDSASGCPFSEPHPDYSVVGSKFNTQKSYKTELSNILREFEGSLKTYESSGGRRTSEGYEQYVTIGDI